MSMARTNCPHAKHLGFWADIFHRCKSPLVVQLLIIALVSGVIGEFKSTVIVGAMVVLSVGLSYVLDRRSSTAVESLGKRVQSRTLVLRDGAGDRDPDLRDRARETSFSCMPARSFRRISG